MRKWILVFVLLMSTGLAWADQSCPPVRNIDRRDVSGLAAYLEKNNFSSIECFIASLPEDIRALRTYIKKSLSLQEASSSHPRALLASPDGGLFLTFNGHPSQKGYKEIEVLAVDFKSGPSHWVPAVIREESGKLHFEKNVKKCQACHGNPVRPIWGHYPSWPNAFGSVDDWLPDPDNLGKDSLFYQQDIVGNDYGAGGDNKPRLSEKKVKQALLESQQFRAFREKAKTHPRYSKLEEVSDETSPVYPYTESYRNRNISFRPNLVIGSLMVKTQNEILRQRIRSNPFYKAFQNSIAHYGSCLKTGTSDEQNKEILSLFAKAYKYKYGKDLPVDPSDPVVSVGYFDLLGVSPHEKTLLFANDTDYLYSKEGSLNGFTYFSGYLGIQSYVLGFLMSDLLSTWPDKEKFVYTPGSLFDIYTNLEELRKQSPRISYFQSKYLGREMHQSLDQALDSFNIKGSNNERASDEQKQIYKEMCSRLESASKQEIMEHSFGEKFLKPVSQQHSHPWPKALNSCIGCHENGMNSVAMLIPFKDPKKLAKFGKSFRSDFGWGNLFDSISILTLKEMDPAHANGLRMPLGHAPLTETERKELLEWVEQGL
ncbi:MAG: hypothetical protein KDD33_02475 [Bdellovibrionales bacterium]|nr:hypothetical protein [Bdellovibrionales bacterium]